MTDLTYTLFSTAIGTCALGWRAHGLSRVWLPDGGESALRRTIARDCPAAKERRPPAEVAALVERLRRHVAGEPQRFDDVALDRDGWTPFRSAVYEALHRTEAGELVSYGELARRIGRPGAARAVGRAMAQNPVPIVIPCHRVLARNGSLGGFSAPGGLGTKEALLAREGALVPGRRRPPFDVEEAVAHLRRDRRMARLIDRVGTFALQLRPYTSTYASLARAIVYQQLSGKAAATIHRRIGALYPGRRRLRPEDVADTPDRALREAGLSRPKLAALRDLTRRALDGELPTREQLDAMSDEAIVEALTPVRGVGRWTVEMLLVFQLGRPDVLPVVDLGIQNGLAVALGGDRPSPETVAERGRRWAPYRSAASWYLWRANDL